MRAPLALVQPRPSRRPFHPLLRYGLGALSLAVCAIVVFLMIYGGAVTVYTLWNEGRLPQ